MNRKLEMRSEGGVIESLKRNPPYITLLAIAINAVVLSLIELDVTVNNTGVSKYIAREYYEWLLQHSNFFQSSIAPALEIDSNNSELQISEAAAAFSNTMLSLAAIPVAAIADGVRALCKKFQLLNQK